MYGNEKKKKYRKKDIFANLNHHKKTLIVRIKDITMKKPQIKMTVKKSDSI